MALSLLSTGELEGARPPSLYSSPSPQHLNSIWHTAGSLTSLLGEQMNVQNESGHPLSAVSKVRTSDFPSTSLPLVMGAQASAGDERGRGTLRLVFSVTGERRHTEGPGHRGGLGIVSGA